MRDGKWKPVPKENQPRQLYDPEHDRTEMNDLAAKRPAKVRELAANPVAWAVRANVQPQGAWRTKPAR